VVAGPAEHPGGVLQLDCLAFGTHACVAVHFSIRMYSFFFFFYFSAASSWVVNIQFDLIGPKSSAQWLRPNFELTRMFYSGIWIDR
jgi:hypothetical protein